MCGIAGVIGWRDDGQLIRQMTHSLRHRGPDGEGHFVGDRRCVGATRLSIVDLAAGVQPVFNETNEICVVFNGEIYNHRELRGELRREGHVFRTETDTEVIVHLYEELGDQCVSRLEGMFAFAVLDGARLFLARDPLGIKPLYISHIPEAGLFMFASEIKALLRCPALFPTLDFQAVADAIALGHLTEDRTYFEEVRSLKPGHTLVVDCEEPLQVKPPQRYYTRHIERDERMTLRDAEDLIAAALDHAVQTHVAADVDVGLTLSGGIDSSLLGFFAARYLDRPISTFSIADHETYVDVEQARAIAKAIGSRHRSINMTFDDFVNVIPDLVQAEEQPSSLLGAPSLWLSRIIAERVRVSLNGEGADEMFGGYTYYLEPDARWSHIRGRLPRLKALGMVPSDAAVAIMRRLSPTGGFNDFLERLFEVELNGPLEHQHLVPLDKCAMASGVEMRVPYLDAGMVHLVGKMPLRFLVRPDLHVRKYILRTLALRRFGPEMIDSALRSKFGAPSAGLVLIKHFDRICDKTISDGYVAQHAFGECFKTKRELLMFDMFIEIFMKHRGDTAAVGGVMEFLRDRSHAAPPLVH